MEISDVVLGFASGVGLAIFTAIITAAVERRNARRARVEEARFEVYMKLLDLYNAYFWVSSAELHNEEVRPELKDQIRTLTWQIADRLRAADEIDHLQAILSVLLSIRIKSASERYRAMDELLNRIGDTVNPRYANAIRQISEENIRLFASGSHGGRTTPGMMR